MNTQNNNPISGQAISGMVGIFALLLVAVALYKGFTGKNISL